MLVLTENSRVLKSRRSKVIVARQAPGASQWHQASTSSLANRVSNSKAVKSGFEFWILIPVSEQIGATVTPANLENA